MRVGVFGLCSIGGACLSTPEAASLSHTTPRDAVAADTRAGAAPVVAPFYLGPADFNGYTLAVDLPRTPGGSSLLVVVPDLGIKAYRRGWDLDKRKVALHVSVDASEPDRPATSGHPVPPRPHQAFSALPEPAGRPLAPLPPNRDFKVFSTDTKAYVGATGRLAYVGPRYAFYEDSRNERNFSLEEYARFDATTEEDYGKLVEVFGAPSDIDANGRVIVFVSRTVRDELKDGQGHVDPCNLASSATRCGSPGEIVYLWSLDGFPEVDARREFYVNDYYPRMLLHETIHLCQHRAALDRHLALGSVGVPPYLGEGQAMLMRFLRPHGGVEWGELSRLLDHLGPHGTPFDSPYALGGLFLW